MKSQSQDTEGVTCTRDTQEANLGLNLGITHEPRIGIGPIGLARDWTEATVSNTLDDKLGNESI